MEQRFGFIHDKLDIKILILFILQRLASGVSLDELAQLTLCDDGISYFDFAECVAELVETEHLKLENSGYVITEKGRRNGSITESSIPYSVRIKAEKNASAMAKSQKRAAMISAIRLPKPDGTFSVMLSMSDGLDELINMELFAVNEQQAKAMERGFRAKAENVFNTVVKILTEEDGKDSAGQIVKEK